MLAPAQGIRKPAHELKRAEEVWCKTYNVESLLDGLWRLQSPISRQLQSGSVFGSSNRTRVTLFVRPFQLIAGCLRYLFWGIDAR
jgi:hypothetical protein